ncbi:hypothetical protein ACRRTK_022245 [Alexandromys fortis]
MAGDLVSEDEIFAWYLPVGSREVYGELNRIIHCAGPACILTPIHNTFLSFFPFPPSLPPFLPFLFLCPSCSDMVRK